MSVDLDAAVAALDGGSVAVIPTETVYGIAAAARYSTAVEAIFELKGRDRSKALPVLAATTEALREVVSFDARAERIAERFWPGPLTLVLPRATSFDVDLGGDDPATVAVRVPAHDLTRALLERTGPLAVTSANHSGNAPATTIDEARAVFGDEVVAYVDAGRCDGTPSTVVSLVGEPRVLRSGGLDPEVVLTDALAS
jgi:tRNA threonylcarbamoyl adenosine modification protein (Sua5/YciO/YrdC/YwlC family)